MTFNTASPNHGFKMLTSGALIALLAFTSPSFADEQEDKSTNHPRDNARGYFDTPERYLWEIEEDQTMLFREPVLFEGEVVEITDAHRKLKLSEDMHIKVPNMALVWNGVSRIYAQDAKLGEKVIVHLRAEEPYPIIKEMDDKFAVGSVDGVFFVPEKFLEKLHENAPYAPESETLTLEN